MMPSRSPSIDGPSTTSRWRAEDGRLRAWLRILLVVVVMLVAAGLAAVPQLWLDLTPALAVQAVLLGLGAVGLFAWLSARLDRRSVRSYGLALDRRWWGDLAVGAVIGLLLGATVLLVLLAVGGATVEEVWSPGAAQPAVGTALAAFVGMNAAVALWEELVFRGHFMSNAGEALARRRSPRRAVIGAWLISSVVFAAIHGNQLASPEVPATVVLLWLAMGGLFGLAYACTGQLGLPIGLHLAANLSLGPLFGLSGGLNEDFAALIRLDLDGPTWLVGGGGLAQLAGVAVAYLAVWLWLWLRARPEPVAIDEGIVTSDPRRDHEHAHRYPTAHRN